MASPRRGQQNAAMYRHARLHGPADHVPPAREIEAMNRTFRRNLFNFCAALLVGVGVGGCAYYDDGYGGSYGYGGGYAGGVYGYRGSYSGGGYGDGGYGGGYHYNNARYRHDNDDRRHSRHDHDHGGGRSGWNNGGWNGGGAHRDHDGGRDGRRDRPRYANDG